MAAATTLVDLEWRSVRSKGVRERRRSPVGGTSYESRQARRERDREDGKLDEVERSELVYFWSGLSSALGCRSVHGAIQDRLMLSPPSIGRVVEDAIEQELVPRGKQGREREKVINALALENGATRHEIRRTLRGMVGAGRVEFFVALQDAKDGEVAVMVEMVRILPGKRRFPDRVSDAEKWRRQDEALERFCLEIHCSDSYAGGGSGLPPSVHYGRADAVGRALGSMSQHNRHVIERAYGRALAARAAVEWLQWGEDVARLVPLTDVTEKARQELVVASSTPLTRRTVDRSTYAADALRAVLDAAPEDLVLKERWRSRREEFIEKARKEAEAMLFAAVKEYREKRAG
jgi:hypothetical protein